MSSMELMIPGYFHFLSAISKVYHPNNDEDTLRYHSLISHTRALAPKIAASASFNSLNINFTLF